MYPVIEIFGREIGTYGIMGVIGILVSAFVGARMAKRYGFSVDDIILLTLTAGAGLFVGGHLLYGLTNVPLIVKAISAVGVLPFADIIKYLAAAFGGMVFYGGLFGCIVAVSIHAKLAKDLNVPDVLDIFAVVIPLFHTFGRIGCFFGGCCYGAEARWGVTFPENKLVPGLAGVPRIPVQLIEAACNLLIFIFIFILWKKEKSKGGLIYVYLPVYATVRFTLEFFRGDAVRGVLLGLSTSQWLSIGILTFSIVRFIIITVRDKRRKTENGTC